MAKLTLKYHAKHAMATAINNYVKGVAVSKSTSIDVDSDPFPTSTLIGKKMTILADGIVASPEDRAVYRTDNKISSNNELAFAQYQGEAPRHIILTNQSDGNGILIPINPGSAVKDTYLFINMIEIEMKGDKELE